MELSSAAMWLNSAFAGYDMAILKLMHALAGVLGVVLTPLMKLVTLLGEKGALMFLLGIVLMCFKRTRKIGVCVFGAVGCGALITNFILKDMIARPRPFETVAQFKEWWQFVGSPAEDDFSFPSGHVTAISAAMVSLWIWKGKKFAPTAIITILVMMISRNYLMAHYPSDVLAAVIVGTAAAFIAYAITLFIFRYVEAYADLPYAALFWTLMRRNLSPSAWAHPRQRAKRAKLRASECLRPARAAIRASILSNGV